MIRLKLSLIILANILVGGRNNTDNYDFYSERDIYAKLTGLHGLYLTKSYDNKCVETERTLWRHENHLKY
jgi:hypothetical protein